MAHEISLRWMEINNIPSLINFIKIFFDSDSAFEFNKQPIWPTIECRDVLLRLSWISQNFYVFSILKWFFITFNFIKKIILEKKLKVFINHEATLKKSLVKLKFLILIFSHLFNAAIVASTNINIASDSPFSLCVHKWNFLRNYSTHILMIKSYL